MRVLPIVGMSAILAAQAVGASAAPIRSTAATAAAVPSGWQKTSTGALGAVLKNAVDLGALDDSRTLHVVVGMKANMSAINALLVRQNRRGDAMYHHYLSPAQAAQFNATGAQINAVGAYLQSKGFTQLSASPNNLLVDGYAKPSQIAAAFATSLHAYRLSNGTFAFANAKPAMVPASLTGVATVLGLNSIAMHTNAHFSGTSVPLSQAKIESLHQLATTKLTHPIGSGVIPNATATASPAPTALPGPTQCAGGQNVNGICIGNPGVPLVGTVPGQTEFWAWQFHGAYNGNTTPWAVNAPMAIMMEGELTSILADKRTYEYVNGLPQEPIQIVKTGPSSPDTSGGGEWRLDSQTGPGIAGEPSKLYLYDATSLQDSDIALEFNRWETDALTHTASASFSGCEYSAYVDGSMLQIDEILAEAGLNGSSMFVSSGDEGSACGVLVSTGVPAGGAPMQGYPTTSAYAVGVGGTTLYTNASDGSYYGELAWDASGGGVSYFEGAAPWTWGIQPAAPAPVDPLNLLLDSVPLPTERGVPDIAMDADLSTGAMIIDNNAETGTGGTSLAAPLANGVWARALSAIGNQGLYAAPFLYSGYPAVGTLPTAPTANITNNVGELNDVIVGTNGQFQATPGWDYVTGLGSMDIAKTVAAVKAAQ